MRKILVLLVRDLPKHGNWAFTANDDMNELSSAMPNRCSLPFFISNLKKRKKMEKLKANFGENKELKFNYK